MENLFTDEVRIFTEHTALKVRKVIELYSDDEVDSEFSYARLEKANGERHLYALQPEAKEWVRRMQGKEPFYIRIGFRPVAEDSSRKALGIDTLYTKEERDKLLRRNPDLNFQLLTVQSDGGILYQLASN